MVKTYILNGNETITFEQHHFTKRYLPIARNVSGTPRPFGALAAKTTAKAAGEALENYAAKLGLEEF